MRLLRNVLFTCGFVLIGHNHMMHPSLDALISSLDAKAAVPAVAAEPKTVEPKAIEPTPVEPKMPMPVEPKMPVPVEPKTVGLVEPKAMPMPEPKMPMPKLMPIAPVGMPPVAPEPAVSQAISSVPAVVQPAAPVEEQAQLEIVDVHATSSEGLDTLNIDSAGNWLEKRIWYKKAEQLFEVIRASVQKASDVRMQFINEVNGAGKKIDEFYETVSFQKGQIDELLKAVLQDFDSAAQSRGGDLSSNERALKVKVQAEQKQIEAIGKDVELIGALDEQIDKTMMKAFKEIDTCRGLETRSWNNFKDIGNELDDKKARVLYYEMENFHKNIEQKMTYLQTNLLPYLQSQLISKVDATISQIKSSVSSLDQKGLNLQKLLEKDEQGDLLILKERETNLEKAVEGTWEEQKAKEAKELKDLKKKQREAAAQNTWYHRLGVTLFDYGQTAWTKVKDWAVIVGCCVKCLVCKIQEMICHLMGY
ncbi:MAG: hypothetical protein NTZ68_01165 [Candidatus Dependentiae bacterium]|nr:hypothetical protein [Candidatus Dependentiae bacterium]